MFQIPRKQIWTSQPQGLVDIDRSNPISSGCVLATNFVDGRGAITGSVVKKATYAGVGLHCSGGGNVAFKIPAATGSVPPGVTVFVQFILVSQASYGALFRKQNDAFTLSASLSSSGAFNYRGINTNVGATPGAPSKSATVGKLCSFAYVAKPDGTDFVYIDGAVGTSGTAGVASQSDGVLCFGLGGGGFTNPDIIYLNASVFNTDKSVAELNKLVETSWQIFKRPDSHIFVPMSTGGGPANITGNVTATLDSITSNLQLVLNHTGTINTSLQDIVVTSSGNLSHSIILNISLDTIDVSIAGSVTAANVVNGTLGITLDDIVANFGGAITHTGTTSFSLDDVFVIFSGTVAGTPENITGDLSTILDGITFTSSGNAGTLTLTDDDINAIMDAIINNPKTLTVPKFLGLK